MHVRSTCAMCAHALQPHVSASERTTPKFGGLCACGANHRRSDAYVLHVGVDGGGLAGAWWRCAAVVKRVGVVFSSPPGSVGRAQGP